MRDKASSIKSWMPGSSWSRADGHYLASSICQASRHREAVRDHLTAAAALRARLASGVEDAHCALAACA